MSVCFFIMYLLCISTVCRWTFQSSFVFHLVEDSTLERLQTSSSEDEEFFDASGKWLLALLTELYQCWCSRIELFLHKTRQFTKLVIFTQFFFVIQLEIFYWCESRWTFFYYVLSEILIRWSKNKTWINWVAGGCRQEHKNTNSRNLGRMASEHVRVTVHSCLFCMNGCSVCVCSAEKCVQFNLSLVWWRCTFVLSVPQPRIHVRFSIHLLINLAFHQLPPRTCFVVILERFPVRRYWSVAYGLLFACWQCYLCWVVFFVLLFWMLLIRWWFGVHGKTTTCRWVVQIEFNRLDRRARGWNRTDKQTWNYWWTKSTLSDLLIRIAFRTNLCRKIAQVVSCLN